jgi:hypothetical protein
LRAPDYVWGYFMMGNGVMLLWSLRLRLAMRAAVALSTAVTWGIIGVSVSYIAFVDYGTISTIGTYSLVGALLCVVAVEQWGTEDRDGQR